MTPRIGACVLATLVALATTGRAFGQAKSPEIVLEFAYGSEKKSWINDVTARYNSEDHRVLGRRVRVNPVPLGSGEMIEEVISGQRQAHMVSPASGVYIDLGNAEWKAKPESGGKDLVAKTESLVISPVVIAMWRPMAKALGWPEKEIGWADVLKIAVDPDGWAGVGHGGFGKFKLGHTHPEYSASGILSLLAEVYAGADKRDDLDLADIHRDKTLDFVRKIERSVVHYGRSTGFFSDAMFANGPTYLSAAVLYESSVVESYSLPDTELVDRKLLPVVAIYPKEGTFLSDHPVGVVERGWVKEEHRAASDDYIKYLRAPEQQKKALKAGFRPGLEGIALASPIDADHGVDPLKPRFHLPVPGIAEMTAIRKELWPAVKKRSQIVFIIDVSTSMQQPPAKIVNAKRAGEQAIAKLDDGDSISLMRFNEKPGWVFKDLDLKDGRAEAIERVRELVVGGDTAMFDAIKEAHDHLQANAKPDMIRAIVVLSDGLNNCKDGRRIPEPELKEQNEKLLKRLLGDIRGDGEEKTTRIFTIYYGTNANKDHMDRIAKESRAESFEGNPATIVDVFKKYIIPFFD